MTRILWPPRKTAWTHGPDQGHSPEGLERGSSVHLLRSVLGTGTGDGREWGPRSGFLGEKVCRMWTELNFLLCAEQKELLTRRLLVEERLCSSSCSVLGSWEPRPPGETPPWLQVREVPTDAMNGCPRWPGSASSPSSPLTGHQDVNSASAPHL